MTVRVQQDEDGIATLTLDQPDRLNPFSEALQQALRDALARLREDASLRVLVITGAGRAFSAGADLSSVKLDPESLREAADRLEQVGNQLVLDVASMPVPVLAAVNGIAAGGGVGLALAADIVLAARSASFYLPFMPALGIVPDMGTSWFLPRAVGRARSTALSLLGPKLPAERAAQWGLIWDCVDDEQLAGETRKIALRLAQLPRHAVTEIRAAHAASARHDLATQLAWEAARQRELIAAPAFAAGVRAFREKRTPDFHRKTDR